MRQALRLAAALALAAPLIGAIEPVAAPASETPAEKPVERKYYLETADDTAMLDAGLAKARAEGKLAVVVFGADWCHDSRSLGRVLTSEAFTSEFGARFAVIFVDVGIPQAGQGRNLDLVARYGVKKMKGLPTMFVIAPNGKRLNSTKDAQSWRNAHSRSDADVLAWFRKLAAKQKG